MASIFAYTKMKENGKDGDCVYESLFRGKMDIECPSTTKIVRIFTSSTFTDTREERNNLMERVYPKLKRYCQDEGYAFQIVDMRWGVRDEAMNDHMTVDLCVKELKLCQKLSTGPNFVTFLSHKNGYRPLPRLAESEEFEKIIEAVENEEDRELINKYL